MSEKLLLKPEEAAAALGISRSRLYELMAAKLIPSVTIGRSRRVPAAALRVWVEGEIIKTERPSAHSSINEQPTTYPSKESR